MNTNRLYTNIAYVEYDTSIENFKETLKNLCDGSFNGADGESHLVPHIIITDDDTMDIIHVTRFDLAWDEYVDESRLNIKEDGYFVIMSILKTAYSYDNDYYDEKDIQIISTDEYFIVFLAYTTKCR